MLVQKLPRPPRTMVESISLVESSEFKSSAGADRLTWMKTQRTNRMKHWPMDDVILNKKLSRNAISLLNQYQLKHHNHQILFTNYLMICFVSFLCLSSMLQRY